MNLERKIWLSNMCDYTKYLDSLIKDGNRDNLPTLDEFIKLRKEGEVIR